MDFSGLGSDPRRLRSRPVDRDHPRVPAALSGLLRLRRRSSRRRSHAASGPRLQGPGADRRRDGAGRQTSPAARLDRRRRTAGPLSRADDDHPAAVEARHPHPAGHQRGARDPRRTARHPSPVHRRVDRRPAAGARCPAHAGDLRSHSQAHRGAFDDRPLHGDAAAGQPTGLHRGVPAASGRRVRRSRRSGSASTRPSSARSPTSACCRPTGKR